MRLEEILLDDNVDTLLNDELEYVLTGIPELNNMIGFDQQHLQHNKDLWEHTLYALKLSPKDLAIRYALLLHDIGKPFCYQDTVTKRGVHIRHYEGHEDFSRETADKILRRLNRYDDDFIEEVCFLIEKHGKQFDSKCLKEEYSKYKKLYELQLCDILAHDPNKIKRWFPYFDELKVAINEYEEK